MIELIKSVQLTRDISSVEMSLTATFDLSLCLQAALSSAGLTPLLLNKFLLVGKRRSETATAAKLG